MKKASWVMGRRLSHKVAFVATTVVGMMLVQPSAAIGAWATGTSSGNTVASGTLAAPTAVSSAIGPCINNVMVAVDVSWTATTSTFARGYQILRGTKATGPFTSVGNVTGSTTVTYRDWTVGFNKTVYYVVRATTFSWISSNSNVTTIRTPGTTCR